MLFLERWSRPCFLRTASAILALHSEDVVGVFRERRHSTRNEECGSSGKGWNIVRIIRELMCRNGTFLQDMIIYTEWCSDKSRNLKQIRLLRRSYRRAEFKVPLKMEINDIPRCETSTTPTYGCVESTATKLRGCRSPRL